MSETLPVLGVEHGSRTTVFDQAGSGGEAAQCGFHVAAPAHADPLGDRAANVAVGRRR